MFGRIGDVVAYMLFQRVRVSFDGPSSLAPEYSSISRIPASVFRKPPEDLQPFSLPIETKVQVVLFAVLEGHFERQRSFGGLNLRRNSSLG